MHHVLRRRRLDVLVAHCLNGFLLRAQLVLENLKLDPILLNGLLFLIKGALKPLHLVLDPLFVSLEEADLFRVELVVLSLFFHGLRTPIESFPLHTVPFHLLLQLVVLVHDLVLLFVKFGLLLLEGPLFRCQVLRLIVSVLKLLSQFQLCHIHLFAEVLPRHVDLLDLNLELLHLFNRLLLLSLSSVAHPLFIRLSSLHFDFKVNSTAPDFAIGCTCCHLLVLNVRIRLFLLSLILVSRLLLALSQLVLLCLNLSPPLL